MTVHFRLAPNLDAVSEACGRLRALLAPALPAGSAIDPMSAQAMELALAEVISNIVRHGVNCRDIRVGIIVRKDRIVASVADNAHPLDMTAIEASLPNDPLAESGRGLWLIRESLDTFEYRHTNCNFHRCCRHIKTH